MDYNYKKKLNMKIKKVTDKDILNQIFSIASEDLYTDTGEKKFSHNNNGIFFDINNLSDEILKKIDEIVSDNCNTTVESDTGNLKYSNYSNEENSISISEGPKLSNKEKNLINNKDK